MSFAPSQQQAAAIAAIETWFRSRTREQQVFRLFGYAGTGKTTITAMAIQTLGLEPMTPGGLGGVLFAAFTGKAALVMTRKGTPPRPPGVMNSRPSASMARAVIVVLPVPA